MPIMKSLVRVPKSEENANLSSLFMSLSEVWDVTLSLDNKKFYNICLTHRKFDDTETDYCFDLMLYEKEVKRSFWKTLIWIVIGFILGILSLIVSIIVIALTHK